MTDTQEKKTQTVWQNRWVRAALGLLAFVAVIMIALGLSQVLVPLAAAFLVAYILNPVCNWIQKILARTLDPVFKRLHVRLAPAYRWSRARLEPLSGPANARIESVANRIHPTLAKKLGYGEKPAEHELHTIDGVPSREKQRYRGAAVGIIAMAAIAIVVLIPVIFIPALVAETDRFVQQARETAEEEAGAERAPFFERVEDFVIERLPLEGIVSTWGLREVVGMDEEVPAELVLRAFVNTYIRENALNFMRTNIRGIADWGQWAGLTTVDVFSRIGQGALAILMFFLNLAIFGFVAVYLLKDYDRVVAHGRDLVPPKYRGKVVQIASDIDSQLRSFFRGQANVMAILAVIYSIGFLICGVPFAITIAIIGGMLNIVPFLGPLLTYIPVILLTWMAHGMGWQVAGAVATIALAQTLESNVLTPNIVGKEIGLHPVWVILAVVVFSGAFGFVGLLLAVPLAATLKVFVVEAHHWYRGSHYYQEVLAADKQPAPRKRAKRAKAKATPAP